VSICKLKFNKREGDMPTIFFYGPRLDKEKRKEMIKSFTDTASRLTGVGKSAFVVYLRESNPEYVGVGGELLEDALEAKQ
jgi:4-oxalocrotonate tautomerase